MPFRLIINVDDFGLNPGVNEAVAILHDAGVVTSTSLMVGGAAVPGAVEVARQRPRLAVGLHVTAVMGPAVLPPDRIPRVVNRDGRFPDSCFTMGLRYTLDAAARAQIREEVHAQFQTFDRLGLGWSHFDFHRHFGLAPVLFEASLDAAAVYPVVGFRIPEDDFRLYRRMDPLDALRQAPVSLCFTVFCPGQRRRLASLPYVTTDRCLGFFRSGKLTVDYLERLLDVLPDGDYELHCHPDTSTPAGRSELETLGSRRFQDALRTRGASLCTYLSLRELRAEATVAG